MFHFNITCGTDELEVSSSKHNQLLFHAIIRVALLLTCLSAKRDTEPHANDGINVLLAERNNKINKIKQATG